MPNERILKAAAALAEIGATGLKRQNGQVFEEFLPQLRGDRAAKVYREMADNDPIVWAALLGIGMHLRRVEWEVVPASEDPEDEERAEFLRSLMDDMSHPWEALIDEALTMLQFGWSYLEIVYKYRVGPDEQDPTKRSKHEDGRLGWRKFSLRGQESLSRWDFDDEGGVQGMWQTIQGFDRRLIPIEKAVLFRTTRNKANPEGRSLLRAAYLPWWRKKNLEAVEAIGIERDLAGLPRMRIPAELMDGTNDTAFERWKDVVANVRQDEQMGVVIPSDLWEGTDKPMFDFDLVTAAGQGKHDTNGIINRYKLDIVLATLTDAMLIGHEAVGSKALLSTKGELMTLALQTFIDELGAVLQTHAVPRVFSLNGLNVRNLPELKPGKVAKVDLEMLARFILWLSQAGAALFPDEGLERHLRAVAELPEPPEDDEMPERPAPPMPEGDVDPDAEMVA